VFAKAREKARQTSCLNNQKQIATSAMMYAQDHDEMLPSASEFWGALSIDKGVLKCPTKSRLANGYVFNGLIAGKALGEISDSSGTMVTADGAHTATTTPTITYDNIATTGGDIDAGRHGGKTILSYVDGHAEITSNLPFPFIPGIVCWLKADTGVTLTSGKVSAWADQSGNTTTFNATQATANLQPTVTAGAVGGYPAITFDGVTDGTGDYISLPSFAFGTVFFVANYTKAASFADYAGLWTENSTSDSEFLRAESGTTSFRVNGAADGFCRNGQGQGGIWMNGTATTSFAPLATFKVLAATPEAGTHTWTAGGRIGKNATNDNGRVWGGNVAEVVIFNAALSAIDRATVTAALRGKYGI
jgi:prepilin-type processing-associated H-X9-DG protein